MKIILTQAPAFLKDAFYTDDNTVRFPKFIQSIADPILGKHRFKVADAELIDQVRSEILEVFHSFLPENLVIEPKDLHIHINHSGRASLSPSKELADLLELIEVSPTCEFK